MKIKWIHLIQIVPFGIVKNCGRSILRSTRDFVNFGKKLAEVSVKKNWIWETFSSEINIEFESKARNFSIVDKRQSVPSRHFLILTSRTSNLKSFWRMSFHSVFYNQKKSAILGNFLKAIRIKSQWFFKLFDYNIPKNYYIFPFF